jgi:hypothetical protein
MSDDQERMQAIMHRIMKALRDPDGDIQPQLAVPSLLYTTGYILSNAMHEGERIEIVLAKCVEDIVFGMQTSTAINTAMDAINKAKGD